MGFSIKEGQKFADKYQIIELLGEGATSKVYLAYNLVDEINVSLKILKNETIDAKKIRNFKREAKAIAMLDDENIIKIYEINEAEGFHYIAQEYVEGITLKDYIQGNTKIYIKEIVEIITQILIGLDHAHFKKVIHKDIKSQNILYGVDKKIKITDFGIADILEDESSKTQSLMGTPQYVAPEVLSRQGATEQTDIYSVGILMYELLMGHAPFTGEKPTIIMMKQLNQPLPSVMKDRKDVPQSLENILIKSTAKKLQNRYKTASEMKEDLATALVLSRRNEAPVVLLNDFDYNTEQTLNLSELEMMKKREVKEHKKRKSRLVIFGVLITVLLLIIGAIILTGNSKMKEMPDIKGKDLETAQLILETNGYDLDQIKVTYEVNNKYPSDTVISTNPKAGEAVDKSKIIQMNVSQGPEKIDIENYLGMSESVAINQLEKKGFLIEINYLNSELSQGTIIDQDPLEGGTLEYGSTITLTVSSGLKQIKVLNFNNITEEEADSWAEEQGVSLSKTKVCNDNYDEGKVFDQNLKYNETISENETIKLKISSGICSKDSSTEDQKEGSETKND